MLTHKIKDHTVAVSTMVEWLLIDKDTPLGIKMLLINKKQGIPVISIRRVQDSWTHWYPLMRFGDTA